MTQAFVDVWLAMGKPAHIGALSDADLWTQWFRPLKDAFRSAGLKTQTISQPPIFRPSAAAQYYWNFCVRLLWRQQKYTNRGVELIDMPPTFATVASSTRICSDIDEWNFSERAHAHAHAQDVHRGRPRLGFMTSFTLLVVFLSVLVWWLRTSTKLSPLPWILRHHSEL
eukprot:UN0103